MKKATIVAGVITSFFFVAMLAYAQSYTPLAPLPGTVTGAPGAETTTMSTYLSGMLKLVIALGAVASVLMAIIGGTQYVAAGISPSAKQGAMERIQGAVTGLILILVSWLILNSISPNLVNFNLNLPPVGRTVSTTADTTVIGATGSNVASTDTTATGGIPATGAGTHTATISNGGTNPAVQPVTSAVSTNVSTVVTNPATETAVTTGTGPATTDVPSRNTSGVSVADLSKMVQDEFNKGMDTRNDRSIIEHCIGNPAVICDGTHLIDGIHTTAADIEEFVKRTYPLDVNGNKILELENPELPAAKSCFFKISTANIQQLLPHQEWTYSSARSGGLWSYSYLNQQNLTGSYCGGTGDSGAVGVLGGTSKVIATSPPSASCGDNDGWMGYSRLGGVCAVDSGFLNEPFGYVMGYHGGQLDVNDVNGQYSNFKAWVTGASTGSSVNLKLLFLRTFLSAPRPSGWGWGSYTWNQYMESTLGRITYATIAQYDLNNDGFADFSSDGVVSDLAGFTACNGDPASKATVSGGADFNQDGKIDCRDLSFVKFMQKDVLGTSGLIPFGFKLNYFESMFFDPTGYTDKQIIKYCSGHKAWFGCGGANVTRGALQMVTQADLDAYTAGAAPLDFNSDGKVDLNSI